MLRQAQAGYRERKSMPNDAPAASPVPFVRMGPLQRLKLAIRRPFIRKGSPLKVPPKPLWFEKGWRQLANANQYTGQFKAAGRSWQGLVEQPYPGGFTAYIWHPPLTEIKRNTSHGPCFMANGEAGRYQVHFHTTPSCLDHAIDNIERVLTHACNGSGT